MQSINGKFSRAELDCIVPERLYSSLQACEIEKSMLKTRRDRRKLTFYFKADRRVDFRELTKENFRIFKSRIWMSMVPKEGESSCVRHGPRGFHLAESLDPRR